MKQFNNNYYNCISQKSVRLKYSACFHSLNKVASKLFQQKSVLSFAKIIIFVIIRIKVTKSVLLECVARIVSTKLWARWFATSGLCSRSGEPNSLVRGTMKRFALPVCRDQVESCLTQVTRNVIWVVIVLQSEMLFEHFLRSRKG